MRKRLNEALVEGIHVLQIYEGGRKLRDLALLKCTVILEYDAGISQEQTEQIAELFHRDTLIVTKKTKNGPVEQDLIPMIRQIEVTEEDENNIKLDCLICCQNPTLNPMQLVAAIERYLPELQPSYCRYCRNEIYTLSEKVFR